MSASRERQRRAQDKTTGLDKRTVQAKKESEDKRKFRIKAIIASAIIVIVILFIAAVNTNVVYNILTAVKIDGVSYSVADFNYWYGTSYMNFYSDYSEYMKEGYFFNPNLSLKKQYFDEDRTQTWAEYFEESAINSMKNVQALCAAAEEADFSLSDEDKANLKSGLYSIDYASYGYKTLGNYLSAIYGKGVNEKVYLDNAEKMYLASYYTNEIINSYDFSAEELASYYDEHSDEFDAFTYNMYYVEAEKSEGAENANEEQLAAAKAIADDIATAKTLDEFSELILKYCPENKIETYSDVSAFQYSYTAEGLSNTFSPWLMSDEAKPGDTTVLEMTNGYYVLYFVDKGGNDYNVVNFRHILFKAAADETTGEVPEEALTNAKNSADGVYAMWQRTGGTEEDLITLVPTYSADGGSSSNGGLYENVAKGDMVEEVEAWLFDESRKPGDSEIIRSTYGYHIMYFVGEGETYWKVLAKEGLENENYTKWIEEHVDVFKVTKTASLTLANYQAR